jgi:hypothetical protein
VADTRLKEYAMDRLLVMVHTVPQLIGVFDRLAMELIPEVKRKHILDEPLLEAVRNRGRLNASDVKRVRSHVEWAQRINADAVLVTCSTISPCVDQIRGNFAIPILKIDEAMIEKAVAGGGKLGVVATNKATIEPTRKMLEAEGERQIKPVVVEFAYVDEAMAAAIAGDGEKHDRLVKPAVLKMMDTVDTVMLAQASMARVLDVIPTAERIKPILSSPYLAMLQTKDVFARLTSSSKEPVK